jgi:hypothetical protein
VAALLGERDEVARLGEYVVLHGPTDLVVDGVDQLEGGVPAAETHRRSRGCFRHNYV